MGAPDYLRLVRRKGVAPMMIGVFLIFSNGEPQIMNMNEDASLSPDPHSPFTRFLTLVEVFVLVFV